MKDNRSAPLYDSGWIYRLHLPKSADVNRVCVMLHGRTGDEYSMDVFLRAIPADYRVLSPRGPYSAPEHGYAWVASYPGLTAPFPDYQITAANLNAVIDRWINQNHLLGDRLALIGFSQGAAMALVFALTYPERVDRVACLSGFLPQTDLPVAGEFSLAGLRVFISHGTQDKIVPVEHARKAALWLKAAGAHVTACESEVGHRLSAPCHRGLKEFLALNAVG